MIHKVFAIYDSKAEAYLPPFFCQTAGVAVRMIQQAADDPQHNFGRFGGDYTLFELGQWDDSTGAFEEHLAHINLGTALALASPKMEIAK